MSEALPVDLYIATKNSGKLRELEELLSPAGVCLRTFADYRDVAEGCESYAFNAALKAEALRAGLLAAGIVAAVLGDDSGLEVAALGGRPGVLSARYGGEYVTWPERRARLLRELQATRSRDRSAGFVCALHYLDAAGRPFTARGEVAGSIAERERGAAGFSYDPLFVYAPLDKTFAEMSSPEKNRVSHRGRAIAALVAALTGGPASGGDAAGSREEGGTGM